MPFDGNAPKKRVSRAGNSPNKPKAAAMGPEAVSPAVPEKSDRLTEFALHDRGLNSAKIFRPLGRGKGYKAASRERTEDEVEINDPSIGGPVHLKVVATYPVGVKEEDILLVLLGLAGLTENSHNRRGRAIHPDDPDYAEVARRLSTKGNCLKSVHYELKVSPFLLLRELSADPDYKPSSDAYKELRPRLERLSFISYVATGMKGNRRWSSGAENIIQYEWLEGDDDDKSITVTLNERITRVLLGYVRANDEEGRTRRWYAKISLRERFSLKSDVARILHRLFSTWIDEPVKDQKSRRGAKGVSDPLPVGIDTLIGHVYGPEPVPDGTFRRRRTDVRKALGEINKLERWNIQMSQDNAMAYVTRIAVD